MHSRSFNNCLATLIHIFI